MTSTMSLTGSFDARDFEDVLGLLARRRSRGRLYVRAGQLHSAIRLVDGEAVGLEVHTPHRWGGKDWRDTLEEVCFEVLRSGRGTFEFQSDDAVADSEGKRAPLASVIEAAQQRLARWREVESIVPSLNSVPRLSETLRCEETTLTQERWRIVAAIDGRRSVSGLARRLDIDPLNLCLILKPLVDDGAVVIDRPDAPPRLTSTTRAVSIGRFGVDVEAHTPDLPDGSDAVEATT